MNILIIDDEKNIRHSLAVILRDEGHAIQSAASGEAGLDLIRKNPPHLVLLDVKLPGLDGIQILERIKSDYPEIDVLMISGNSDINTAVQAVKLGAYDFMEKPLSLPKVVIAVKNIADHQKLSQKYALGEAQWDERYRIIGKSPEMESVRKLIRRVAQSEAKVLITGESGTGKELVAYSIHKYSPRHGEPFVTFNSAALPQDLVESELFGYEKGAFTGADRRKPGKLEVAHGGSIFLDEIGDMNLNAQAKILRVIEEGKFERVGGNQTIDIDVRILAATNRNLEAMIAEGSFREDLFYRLNVVPIHLPPLRERSGDIAVLLEHFLDHYARELKLPRKAFSQAAWKRLLAYSFPGNVREMKNLVERLYILTESAEISQTDLLPHLGQKPVSEGDPFPFLQAGNFNQARQGFERFFLQQALEQNGWNISRTAQQLGLQQPNLSRKIRALHIENPHHS